MPSIARATHARLISSRLRTLRYLQAAVFAFSTEHLDDPALDEPSAARPPTPPTPPTPPAEGAATGGGVEGEGGEAEGVKGVEAVMGRDYALLKTKRFAHRRAASRRTRPYTVPHSPHDAPHSPPTHLSSPSAPVPAACRLVVSHVRYNRGTHVPPRACLPSRSPAYVRALAACRGFEVRSQRTTTIRYNAGVPIIGDLYVLQRSA